MYTDFSLNSIDLNPENESSSEIESSESSTNVQNEICQKTLINTDINYFNLTTLANDIYEHLVEHIALDFYFFFYKAHLFNSIQIKECVRLNDDFIPSESKGYDNKLDIYGHSLNGIKKLECVCPNCSRSLAALRLAPHLEKCLGMGRNSSRLASKRIALVIKNSNGSNSE